MGRAKKQATQPPEKRVLRRSPRTTAPVEPPNNKPPRRNVRKAAPSSQEANEAPMANTKTTEVLVAEQTTEVEPRQTLDTIPENAPATDKAETTSPAVVEQTPEESPSATVAVQGTTTETPLITTEEEHQMAHALILHPTTQVTTKNPRKTTIVKEKFLEPQKNFWFFTPDGELHTEARASSSLMEEEIEEIICEQPPEKDPSVRPTKKDSERVVNSIFLDTHSENPLNIDINMIPEDDANRDSWNNTIEGGGWDNTVFAINRVNPHRTIDEILSHENPHRVISDDQTHHYSPEPTEREEPHRANLDCSQTDDNEPLINRLRSKRKKVGKGPAKKAAKRPRKQAGKVTFEGESSQTYTPRTTAAATVLQQQFGGGDREEEGTEDEAEGDLLVDRPDKPWHGLSCKAAEKVWFKFENKVGLPDKGFNRESIYEFQFIKEVVVTQHLAKVCMIYKSYNLPLVRDFYCELAVTSSSKIPVRGVQIRMTAKAINAYLGLNPPKSTEYNKLVKNTTMDLLQKVAEVLGKPKTTWDYHSNIMSSTFKGNNLTDNANVWANLVRHSIQPTTHDTHLSVERMLLLYCLITGKTINLGKIILKSIRECNTRTRGRFYFPGMLTAMLIEMGVPQYKDDVIIKQQREPWELDLKAVTRMRERRNQKLGIAELNEMLNEVLKQNSNLIDHILKQRAEFMKELEESKAELMLKAEEVVKKGAEEIFKKKENEHNKLLEEVTKLKKTVLDQKEEIQKLSKRIAKGDSATSRAAAASAAAVQNPTPHE